MYKKGRPPSWGWLVTALRAWWTFYVGTVLLAVILSLLTQGPSQSLAFLSYAHTAPLIFWPTLVVLNGMTLAGLTTEAIALLARRRDPHHRRKHYLEEVAKHYRYIPLVVDVAEVQELPEFVYQPMRWYEDVAKVLTDPAASQAVGTPLTDIDEVLERRGQRALVILGWPGSGKTTLLRHHMSRRAITIAEDANALLPVYISLPLFAPLVATPDGIKTYLQQYESAFKDKNEVEYAEQVQTAVQAGNAYLYLDGLDEVDGQYREHILAWICERQRALALRGALLVGTRYTEYERADFLTPVDLPDKDYAVFTELVAQPMDANTRTDLARSLFRALAEQLKKPTPSDEQVQAFVWLVETEPKRAEWAANPLLFSLAVYLYVSGSANQGRTLPVDFPVSRVTLYRQFIQTLLAKVVRKRQAEGTGEGLRSGVLYEMVRVLAEVAVRLYTLFATPQALGADSSRYFSEAQLNRAVDATRTALGLSYQIGTMSAWIVESGTLSVIRPQTFAFRHPTYGEYLATLGHVLRLVSESENLVDMGTLRANSAWAGPMQMLAGVLVDDESPEGNVLATSWLELLFSATREGGPDEQADALELLIVSLCEIPGVDTVVQTEQANTETMLVAWVEALLNAAQRNDRERLERLQHLSPGVATLPKTLAQSALGRLEQSLALSATPEQQRAGAKVLAGMGSIVTDLAPLLLLLCDGQDELARIEAARTLASLEDATQRHPGCDALKTLLNGPDASLAALVAQSVTGVDHPDAISVMLMAVETARDPDVRRLGALALGSVGARMQARESLDRLSYDADKRVAEAALTALTNLGEDRSRLASAIEQQARQGADVSSVLQALLPYTLRQLGFAAQRFEGVEVILPPVCDVPAGPFLMGSNKQRDAQADGDERPQHTVTLATFQIARYPVTVAEYACYVRATNNEPTGWQPQLTNLDHPVVNVSWKDAIAYVEWLARTTGHPWRLPTEAEWEKAARGTDGRIFPWGDVWDTTCANTWDGGPHVTTVVGSYPNGASPYEAHDMAGNVWEWTISVYKPYPYNPAIAENPGDRKDVRVLRGGSWYYLPRFAHAACRNWGVVNNGYTYSGFRVVRGVGTAR